MQPGAAAADAPLERDDRSPTWLLRELGDGFSLLWLEGPGGDAFAASLEARDPNAPPLTLLRLGAGPGAFADCAGLAAERYDLRPGSAVLLRPDRHVCARWRAPTAAAIDAAIARALAIH